MPGIGRYVVTFTNDAIGTGNPAQCTFDALGDTGMTVERVAGSIAYFFAGGATMAGGTRIPVVTFREPGATGAVPVAWDDQWWTVLRAAFPEFGVTDWDGWNTAFGAGPLTPLGTSVTVLEQTGTPGRRSTGRKYIPFLSGTFVNAAGQVAPAAVTNIAQNYATLLISGATPDARVRPLVKSKFPEPAGMQYIVTSARVMPTASNLRRRRR